MAYNNLRIGENHKFFTDVSLGVRRLVWDQEAVNSTFTRPTTFAVIEGYSSTKTFVQGSHRKTPVAYGRNRVFRDVINFGWEHIARYSDLSRKNTSNCLAACDSAYEHRAYRVRQLVNFQTSISSVGQSARLINVRSLDRSQHRGPFYDAPLRTGILKDLLVKFRHASPFNWPLV